MTAAGFHDLFVQHWDAGTGMPGDRRRVSGSWTTKDFADSLARLNCPVDAATIDRWRNGTNQTNRRATLLAILAVFFPQNAGGTAQHPDRQKMLDAWTQAQRRAGRPQPDAADMQQAGAALLAAPREPDAIGFVVSGPRLAIAPPPDSDRAAAALPLVQALLPLVVEKLRDLDATVGARLDNQPAWRSLPTALHGLIGALGNATPETLPDLVVLIYHRTLTLGSCVELDDRLGATPSLQGEPLEPEIRRSLADSLKTLATWLLQFPSVREADAAQRGFLTRPELFEAVRPRLEDARRVIQTAAATRALSEEDAAEAAAPAEIAATPGMQGEKAGYRAISTARHLAVTALGWKLSLGAALLTGAVASDYATKSALVGTLGSFLAQVEAPVIRLVEGSPYDLITHVRHGLALAREDGQPEVPDQPAMPPQLPRRPEEEAAPPPDFDLDEAVRRIEAGQAPPEAWWPFIIDLPENFEKRAPHEEGLRCTTLTPLAGLRNLQRLSLNKASVADLAPIAGLDKLTVIIGRKGIRPFDRARKGQSLLVADILREG